MKLMLNHKKAPAPKTIAIGLLLFTTSAKTLALAPTAVERKIMEHTSSLRHKIPPLTPPDPSLLYFSSAFSKNGNPRGFCNWLIPNRLIVGQYPGKSPERDGPTEREVQAHVQAVLNAGVSVFCSLQSEIPDQEDGKAWDASQMYFPPSFGYEFPFGFARYSPNVRLLSEKEVEFWHFPVMDLCIPDATPLLVLLSRLLCAMDQDKVVYLHCWGGRGRAGTVGACLLSRLYPELDSESVLRWVQMAYDTRDGAKNMPSVLQRSPQTREQRDFVRKFVDAATS